MGRPAVSSVRASHLVQGDVIRLRDGRRVEVMAHSHRPHSPVANVRLWEIGTDAPNFSFTLRADSLYDVEPEG